MKVKKIQLTLSFKLWFHEAVRYHLAKKMEALAIFAAVLTKTTRKLHNMAHVNCYVRATTMAWIYD